MKYFSSVAWIAAIVVAFLIGRGMKSSADEGRALVRAAERNLPLATEELTAITSADAEISGTASEIFAKPDLVGLDVERALGEAFRETDPLRRKQQLATILAGLTRDNVAEALAAFEEGPRGAGHDEAFRDFLHAWGRIDGAATMAYLMNPESPRRDHLGGSHAMSGWAMSDPAAAQEYVANIDNEHAKEWLHYGAMLGVMNNDLEAAVAYSEENKLGTARGRQMDRLADRFYEIGGAETAIGWLEGIDHKGENDRLAYKRYSAKAVMARVAKDDPAAARAWIEANAAQPFVPGDAISTVATSLSKGDRAAGLDWIASLPESEARGGAMLGQIRSWAGRDANAAAEWLGIKQDDPNYNEAVSGFVAAIAERDPASAMAWSETTQDPGTMAQALKIWMRQDPEAAQAWEDRQAGD